MKNKKNDDPYLNPQYHLRKPYIIYDEVADKTAEDELAAIKRFSESTADFVANMGGVCQATGTPPLSKFRRMLRIINWWLDRHVWFHISMMTLRWQEPEYYNHILEGLHEFAWMKYCGYGWKFALHRACIYWKPTRK